MFAAATTPDADEVVRAVTLLVWLTGVLVLFVAMVALLTIKRRSRLRRERVTHEPTRLTDAWAEAGRRMAVAPSRRSPDDGPPPLDDDDDDPTAKTRGPGQ